MRAVPLLLLLAVAACDGPVAPTPPVGSGGLFDGAAVAVEARAVDGSDWRWAAQGALRCRDGSATGFGIRPAEGSRRLLIVLDGGGSCSTPETCGRNRAAFSRADFEARLAGSFGRAGVFADRDDNPLAGWNAAFVPYCTGDLHLGNAPGRAVDSVGVQDFVGRANLEAVLEALAPAAREADAVVLAGFSAGGFGASVSYDLAARRLAPAPVHLLDDAGPFLPDTSAFSPRIEARLAALWNVGPSLPEGCAACAGGGVDLAAALPFVAARYPERSFGVVAFEEDLALRNFFGAVEPLCATRRGPLCQIPPEAYRDGLRSLRRSLETHPNAGTFYIGGSGHGSILTDELYGRIAGGEALDRWIARVVAGDPVPDRGEPAP